jgi:malonyl-CoA O-methyltransferase
MNISKLLLKNNFSLQANKYSINAEVQKYSAKNLVKLLNIYQADLFNLNILDLGSGTGFVGQNIFEIFANNFHLYELDLSEKMLNLSKNHSIKICDDFNNLPFKKNSFDIIISSFSLQWCENFDNLFKKIFTILKANGLLVFCLPTNDSLQNLRCNTPFIFNDLPKTADLITLLNNNNFNKILQQDELFNENFTNPIIAIKSLKKIGANILINNSNRKKFSEIKNFYLKNYNYDLLFINDWVISYFIYTKNV